MTTTPPEDGPSSATPVEDAERPVSSGPVGTALRNTPNAERYVLEADAMRRRQLRSALLHGSRRTWRDNPRVWPAVVVGLIVAGVIIAGLAVTQALQKTQDNEKKQEQQQEQQQKQQDKQQKEQEKQQQEEQRRLQSPSARPSGAPSGQQSGQPSGQPSGASSSG